MKRSTSSLAAEPSQARQKADAKPARPVLTIGWMECIDLPDIPLNGLKAKIDTGARTSALHADRIQAFERDGAPWVRFRTEAPGPGGRARKTTVEAPISERKHIKNTSGIPEERIVIRTRIRLGKRSWRIDLSLADRGNMTFPMIVGRAALKNHSVAVHTRKTYLVTNKPVSSRRKDNP